MNVSSGQSVASEPARAKRIVGLNRRHVGQMMVQLSDLLEAGCPLTRALDAIGRQASQPPLAALAGQLHGDLVNGVSLAEAMDRRGGGFSSVQVSMVRAAEAGGFLQQTLSNLAEHAARHDEAVKQVKAKLAYPIVLAITATASVVFLLTYIVPRFSRIYQASRQLLPAPTRALLAVSGFIASYWVGILAGIIAAAVALALLYRQAGFRARWDACVLRLPVLGPAVRDWEMSRFAGTMALLLSGGVTVLRALRLARQVVGRAPLRSEIDRLATAVERGERLSGSMANSRFFDATVKEMIVVSEASGKLAMVLERLAGQRYRDFRTRTDTLLSLVEPVIILVIGAIVGLTVIALLLPVFLLNTMVVG